MIVESVQIGEAREFEFTSADVTGIFKNPVANAEVGAAGLAGDTIGDERNHGGPDQAVYLYCRPDYDWWSDRLDKPLEAGLFGENLTITDLSSADVMVGDKFAIGTDLVVQATAARIPCRTFQAKLGEADWVARFRDARRPGFYARVLSPGGAEPGQSVLHTPAQGTISILETQDLYYDREPGQERLEAAIASPIAIRMRTMVESRLNKR